MPIYLGMTHPYGNCYRAFSTYSDMKLQQVIAADEREAWSAVQEAQRKARRRLARPKAKKNSVTEPLLNHHSPHGRDYTLLKDSNV